MANKHTAAAPACSARSGVQRRRHQVGGGVGEYVTAGFGLGLGSALAMMLLLVLALAFLIPGYILVLRQHKLPKEQRSTGLLVLGYVLMVLGVVVGLGFGGGALLGLLAQDVA